MKQPPTRLVACAGHEIPYLPYMMMGEHMRIDALCKSHGIKHDQPLITWGLEPVRECIRTLLAYRCELAMTDEDANRLPYDESTLAGLEELLTPFFTIWQQRFAQTLSPEAMVTRAQAMEREATVLRATAKRSTRSM